MVIGFLVGYLLILVVFALFARRQRRPGHEDYFLARRRLTPLVLFFTLAATNFSSFTIFGFAGAGYRSGYAYYPIMAFGTGFMALTFLLLGIPAWRAARASGAITPPELIGYRFQNRFLHAVYLLVMVVFTLPYLALQPIGAGYMLKSLLGIPYHTGVLFVVFAGLFYVLIAGLRGDAWTDLFQGLLMLFGIAIVFAGMVRALGGWEGLNRQLSTRQPGLFSRPGLDGMWTPKIWLSYLLLWFLCDPMFPQLFQRFLAARDERGIKLSALLYPLITGLLFFFPVALGVIGHLVVPGLEGTKTDQVLPLMVGKTLAPLAGGILTLCGLAALMSTMDSQLLTLSSMLVRDIRLLLGRPPEGRTPWHLPVTVILALSGLFLALKPWGTILNIATQTFTGLAVLFPVTIAGAYWKRANPWAGLVSVVTGEALVVAYHLKLLPDFGFLPVVPIVGISALVLIIGSLIFPARGLAAWAEVKPGFWRQWIVFGAIFILSLDFYNWHRHSPVLIGLPLWLWFHILLNALLFLAIFLIIFRRNGGQAQPHPET